MNPSVLEDLWTVVRLAAEGSDWKRDEGETLSAWAQRRLTRPEGGHGWIPVSGRLPDESGHYLGWDAGHGATTAFFENGRWKDCFGWDDSPITHWMPLPAKPAPQPVMPVKCECGLVDPEKCVSTVPYCGHPNKSSAADGPANAGYGSTKESK